MDLQNPVIPFHTVLNVLLSKWQPILTVLAISFGTYSFHLSKVLNLLLEVTALDIIH